MTTKNDKRLLAENRSLRFLLERAGIDAEEHKMADDLQRILFEEMHHRVKNMLASVQAIMTQSLRSAETLEQGTKAIEARLAALGRVQDLLLHTSLRAVTLAELLTSATEPFDTPGASQFLIQSTGVEVSAAAALPLAMVLNELCTNAVKYGALSVPEGRVSVTTTPGTGSQTVRLTWAETGGPRVQEPTRHGFGSRLIERSFESQLHEGTALMFLPTGLVATFDIPIAAPKPKPDDPN